MHIPWNDVALFLAVAETASFSAAARRLGLGQPTISRRIAQLEELLERALFFRGAEGAQLTAAGERLLPVARRMAECAGELERLATDDDPTPEGVVRVAAPPGIAFDFLAPFAAHLAKRSAGLRLEVLASVTHLDLLRNEADLALRTKKPTLHELACLAEVQIPARAFASKDYVKRLRPKYGPADVDWITWAPPYHNLPPRPQLEKLIDGFEPSFTSDSFLVQRAAAEAGLGAMFAGIVDHRFVRRTRLVPLDLDFGVVSSTYLVCAQTMVRVPRVRAVIDLLLEEIGRTEGIELTVQLDPT